MPDFRVLIERRFLFEATNVASPEQAIIRADDVFRQIDDLMAKSRYPYIKVVGAKSSRRRAIPADIVMDLHTIQKRVEKIKNRWISTHSVSYHNEEVAALNRDLINYISSGLCLNPEELAAAAAEVYTIGADAPTDDGADPSAVGI